MTFFFCEERDIAATNVSLLGVANVAAWIACPDSVVLTVSSV